MTRRRDEILYQMLHDWDDEQLMRALRLVLTLCNTWPIEEEVWPIKDGSKGVIDWSGRRVPFIAAIEVAASPVGGATRAWRQALLLAAITLAMPAADLFFGDHDFVMHRVLGTAATCPTRDFATVDALLRRHINDWASRHYSDVAQFVTAFQTDWCSGL